MCLGNTIFQQHVRGEELTGLRLASLGGVADVVGALGRTRGGTKTGIEGAVGECLRPHEGIATRTVKGGVEGRITQIRRARVPVLGRNALADIAVGPGNHHLELVAPPSRIVGVFLGHRSTPEHALDVSGGGRVRTSGRRLLCNR